jgi:large subunit ribosomal protein L5e
MKKLKNENPTKYEKHFSNYIVKGIDTNNIKEMYLKLHEAIRENPEKDTQELLGKMKIKK